jgi:hypothetical protein
VQVGAERLCSKRFGSQVAFRYALEAMLGRRACGPISFHVRRSSSLRCMQRATFGVTGIGSLRSAHACSSTSRAS